MARHPLQTLLRVRGIALDAARRALADRLQEELAAADRCSAISATIAREAALQVSLPVQRGTTKSYVAWLERTQLAHRDAEATVRARVAATVEARASLNEERTGVRALEAVLEQIQAVARDTAARVEQAAVDEAAAGCKRPERWSG